MKSFAEMEAEEIEKDDEFKCGLCLDDGEITCDECDGAGVSMCGYRDCLNCGGRGEHDCSCRSTKE